jgi:hypothetical protein
MLHPMPDAIYPNVARQGGKTITQFRFGQLIVGKSPSDLPHMK